MLGLGKFQTLNNLPLSVLFHSSVPHSQAARARSEAPVRDAVFVCVPVFNRVLLGYHGMFFNCYAQHTHLSIRLLVPTFSLTPLCAEKLE